MFSARTPPHGVAILETIPEGVWVRSTVEDTAPLTTFAPMAIGRAHHHRNSRSSVSSLTSVADLSLGVSTYPPSGSSDGGGGVAATVVPTPPRAKRASTVLGAVDDIIARTHPHARRSAVLAAESNSQQRIRIRHQQLAEDQPRPGTPLGVVLERLTNAKLTSFAACTFVLLFTLRARRSILSARVQERVLGRRQEEAVTRAAKDRVLARKFYGASSRSMALHLTKQRQTMKAVLADGIAQSRKRMALVKFDRLAKRAIPGLPGDGDPAQQSRSGGLLDKSSLFRPSFLPQEDHLFDRTRYRESVVNEIPLYLRRTSFVGVVNPMTRSIMGPEPLSEMPSASQFGDVLFESKASGSVSFSNVDAGGFLADSTANATDGVGLLRSAPGAASARGSSSPTAKDSNHASSSARIGMSVSRESDQTPTAMMTKSSIVAKATAGTLPATRNIFLWHFCWRDEPFEPPHPSLPALAATAGATKMASLHQRDATKYVSQVRESELGVFTCTKGAPDLVNDLVSLRNCFANHLSNDDADDTTTAGTDGGTTTTDGKDDKSRGPATLAAAAAGASVKAPRRDKAIALATSATFEPFELHFGMEHSQFVRRSLKELRRQIDSHRGIYEQKRARLLQTGSYGRRPDLHIQSVDSAVRIQLTRQCDDEIRQYGIDWFARLKDKVTATMNGGLNDAMKVVFDAFEPLFGRAIMTPQLFEQTTVLRLYGRHMLESSSRADSPTVSAHAGDGAAARATALDGLVTAPTGDECVLVDLGAQFTFMRLHTPFGVSRERARELIERSGASYSLMESDQVDAIFRHEARKLGARARVQRVGTLEDMIERRNRVERCVEDGRLLAEKRQSERQRIMRIVTGGGVGGGGGGDGASATGATPSPSMPAGGNSGPRERESVSARLSVAVPPVTLPPIGGRSRSVVSTARV